MRDGTRTADNIPQQMKKLAEKIDKCICSYEKEFGFVFPSAHSADSILTDLNKGSVLKYEIVLDKYAEELYETGAEEDREIVAGALEDGCNHETIGAFNEVNEVLGQLKAVMEEKSKGLKTEPAKKRKGR